jgi:hypothetical protein
VLTIDRASESLLGEIIAKCPNRIAASTLETWGRHPQDQFVIVAGELWNPNAGIVGGIARGWQEAAAIFRYVHERLDELSPALGMSSMWAINLSPENEGRLRALMADMQHTAGTA